jgi:hypothetical protein
LQSVWLLRSVQSTSGLGKRRESTSFFDEPMQMHTMLDQEIQCGNSDKQLLTAAIQKVETWRLTLVQHSDRPTMTFTSFQALNNPSVSFLPYKTSQLVLGITTCNSSSPQQPISFFFTI